MKFPARLTTARGSFADGALVKYKPGAVVATPPVVTPPSGGGGTGGTGATVATGTSLFATGFGDFDGNDVTVYTSGPAQGSGVTASFDTSWFISGTQSLRITAGSTATYNAGYVWPITAAVTPGQFIQGTGTVRRGSGTTKAQMSVDYFNSSGTYISGTVLAAVPATAGTTLAFNQTSTVPAGAVSAQITARFTTNPPATGDYWQIDGFQASVVATNPNDGVLGGTIAPRATAGAYTISGTKLLKDGVPFKVVGANIGVNAAIGGNYSSDESISAHTTEAITWGWNYVRLHVYVSTTTSWIASYTLAKTYQDIFNATDKYLAAGFIVQLAVMDQTIGLQAENEQAKTDFDSFFTAAATRYINESRVWYDINEPSGPYNAATWIPYMTRFYNTIRATGNNNIFVSEFLTNSQDARYANQTKVWDPTMGPAFLANAGGTPRTNVLFALHNYGGQVENTWGQTLANSTYNDWAQKVHDAGLAYMTGEFGFQLDPSVTDWNRMHLGFYAGLQQQFSNGLSVWSGTNVDTFTLKSVLKDQYHGNSFFYGGANIGLSELGVNYWNWCHAYTAPSWT